MNHLYTFLLVVGYIGHCGLFFKQGMYSLGWAMVCFAVAMILLFRG